jgi:hypothetical protein
MEYVLNEHDVDTCLLDLAHPESDIDLRFLNFFSHRKDRRTRKGGSEFLARRGIDHYAVPFSGLQHREAAIHLVLGTKPLKLVAV